MSLTEDDKHWITTQLEAVETRLLRALDDGASPAGIRARSRAAVLRVLDIKIESPGSRGSRPEPPQ